MEYGQQLQSQSQSQPRPHLSGEYSADDRRRGGFIQTNSWAADGENGDWSEPPAVHSLTSHSNRSVPSFSNNTSFDDPEPVPPLPSNYDPTTALDSFHALHITDPVPRAASVVSESAKSFYSARSSGSGQERYPTHASTLPPRPHPGRPHHAEGPSAGPYPHPYAESYDPYAHPAANGYSGNDVGQAPSYPGSQSHYVHSPSNLPHGHDYNVLYAAASDVLGVGLPPNPHSGVYSRQTETPAPTFDPRYAQSTISVSSSASGPARSTGSGASVQHSLLSPTSTVTDPVGDDVEIEERPSYLRSGTATSVKLQTQKTKAVDLRSPPYTKQYIDEYRQRIKADPDPESHFAYARYLIDAAKKIGADAKDQRAVRKYRDTLVQEALKVMRRLATQGQPYDEAQFFLANCHGTGTLGLQVDHEKAYHLYLQAAKQNHAAATYRVAVCNEIGAGTRKEPPRAAAFYRKAASLGDTPAMYKLGMILLQGSLGEARNPREAVGWLRRAAEQADEEYPHALHELALLHENASGQVVPYDPHQARELYTRAAYLGYTQSQYKLGQCYEYGALGCPVDPRRSIAWYTKAAEKGNSEAELALSGWYLTGSEGVLKQSDSEAYLWARRAANKGLSKAEYAVGYYAEVGIGIKQDVEFAKRWYMRAAAQGNKRAMSRLTEMKRQGNKRSHMARPTRQQAEKECIIA